MSGQMTDHDKEIIREARAILVDRSAHSSELLATIEDLLGVIARSQAAAPAQAGVSRLLQALGKR